MPDTWQNRLQKASSAELTQGFTQQYACLYCKHTAGDRQEAGAHLKSAHGDPLKALLALDKSFTGLTDRQKELLLAWREGVSDGELAARTGNSASTLRNQRFALRERALKAQLFLAALTLAGVMEEEGKRKSRDGIEQFFREGRLLQIPAREKKRHEVMVHLSRLFTPGVTYTDRQVRDMLKPIYEDYAQIRRYLADYGLLHRTQDNRLYWREEEKATEEKDMPIDKKAAKAAYKNTVTPMGVYRYVDRQTGRYLLGSDRNLGSVQNRFQFTMFNGKVAPGGPLSDPQLFEDYRDHPDAFVYEVLESVDIEKYPTYEEAAEQLEALYKKHDGLYPREMRYRSK